VSVKIRLTRMGRKKVPMYRVVIADERAPRDGRYIEIIGQYQPLEEPALINIEEEELFNQAVLNFLMNQRSTLS